MSDFIIPFLIFYIVGLGLLEKVEIYDAFVEGAKKGMEVVKDIVPTLLGLMLAIGVLRASGVLDFIASVSAPVLAYLHFPPELLPLTLIKMISSSGATGILLDIYKQFGTDSRLGLTASILMSCSETIFYTMSVYFVTAKVNKSRYTLAGALLATLAGTIATLWLGEIL